MINFISRCSIQLIFVEEMPCFCLDILFISVLLNLLGNKIFSWVLIVFEVIYNLKYNKCDRYVFIWWFSMSFLKKFESSIIHILSNFYWNILYKNLYLLLSIFLYIKESIFHVMLFKIMFLFCKIFKIHTYFIE